MDIHHSRPRPIADLPVTVNSLQTRGGLSNALPFSGEAAAELVRRCYTRKPCGGFVRCNGWFDGKAH